VNFADWTPDGHLRAPVFLRLRDDVKSRSVRDGPRAEGGHERHAAPVSEIEQVLEQLEDKSNRIDLQVGAARIRLTNLDREYWPAAPTRAASRDHEARPAALSRARVAVRAASPRGSAAHDDPDARRHQRRALLPEALEPGAAGVRRDRRVYSGSKDEQQDYLLANNLPTLIWLGQVGTLEFHVWHSRMKPSPDAASQSTDFSSSLEALESSVLNYPDYLVFDIDPYIYSGKEPKGAEPELNKKGFATGRRVAFWLRDLLKEMSLEAVVKTSGKTGCTSSCRSSGP
jgi:bifunctional non-homologous end joining protein LigD